MFGCSLKDEIIWLCQTWPSVLRKSNVIYPSNENINLTTWDISLYVHILIHIVISLKSFLGVAYLGHRLGANTHTQTHTRTPLFCYDIHIQL